MIVSAALNERAQRQNGLAAARPPSHAGAFEPFGHQGLACRLDDAGADGQSPSFGIGVAHAVAIATEVAQHLCDSLIARILRAQIHQRPNDAVDPIRLMAQQMAILLELRRGLGGVGSVGGVEGVFEMLDGVVEVDELDSFGQRAGEERPLSFAPSASLTTVRSGRLPSTASTSAATIVFSVVLFDSGIRPMRTLCSRCPSPSTSDTVAQPASRYPPRIGAITPSSETTTARATSGTSTVASRTVVSNASRCASQRADSALGSRSRLLFDGCMCASAHAGICTGGVGQPAFLP